MFDVWEGGQKIKKNKLSMGHKYKLGPNADSKQLKHKNVIETGDHGATSKQGED